MLFKHERSDLEIEQSMSPEEYPTPPDSPKTTAVSTPSSFGFTRLYGTPLLTTTEVDEEMGESKMTSSNQSFDSMDIGIPHIPSDWMLPSSP